MPKIKTNRAAAKRFKRTGTGKIKRHKAYGSHMMGHKTTKQKRGLRGTSLVDPSNVKGIKRMLPGS